MQKLLFDFFVSILIIAGGHVALFAQPKIEVEHKVESEGFSTLWYVAIFIFSIALFAVLIELSKRKKAERAKNRRSSNSRKREIQKSNTIDLAREIEWYKNRTARSVSNRRVRSKKPRPVQIYSKIENAGIAQYEIEITPELPIFGISKIEPAPSFTTLPLSNDESLLSAIEQVKEEYEEDEEMRHLALRILANFRTRNSVEAIAELALYDFSSKLRSQAVSTLAEFDHESVFESLLLACADPGREVRAAAARGLFRVTFDRTEAWLRIYESSDLGKVRQCARALIAGDLVIRSLERLIHQDAKYAAEAFSVALILIKAGETEEIFRFLKSHKSLELKKALLHVIKIADEPYLFDELINFSEQTKLPEEVCGGCKKICVNGVNQHFY